MAKGAFSEQASARADGSSGTGTLSLLAFVTDAASGAVLQDSLAEHSTAGIEVQQGTIAQAIAAMLKRSCPKVLLVDVTGAAQPLEQLSELSDVLEPSVRVLVIGDRQDMNFYRQVTRSLGAAEYLYKPLSPDMVARHFGPVLSGEQNEETIGGRLLTVTGVRGGAGATTVAVNMAWHLAENAKRYTLLLDPNQHTGNVAMMLGLKSGEGLRTALESPERVDAIFVERAGQSAGTRLHVFSGETDLAETPETAPHAASHLVDLLRQRYNFIIADVPSAPVPLYKDVFNLADQRMLVVEPSLVGVRETLRLLALPNAPRQRRRAALVLNGADRPGGLTTAQVEDALEMQLDFILPYLPKQTGAAALAGKPVIEISKEFHTAIKTMVDATVSVGTAPGRTSPARLSLWARLGRAK